jgi:thiamine biosynthesis lipoprotein
MTSSKFALLLLAVCAQASELKLFEAVEPHMGTLVRIKLYAVGQDEATVAFRAAFRRIEDLDAALSDYQPDSELNRAVRNGVGAPVRVSDDLFRVLRASQKLAAETGGAFDVTLGPVIRLWREARKNGHPPAEQALAEARGRTGYGKLHLDSGRQTVKLDQGGMQVDLGAIGKGYAADEALAVLAKIGIGRALVAMSGDLAFGDPPPGQDGWKIGTPSQTLELANAAVSTSGDAEQHLDAGGQRYSHIIDPATGSGLTHSPMVTVVARRGIDSDALSTAVSILGPERGLALVNARPDAAALIVEDGRLLPSARWAMLHTK